MRKSRNESPRYEGMRVERTYGHTALEVGDFKGLLISEVQFGRACGHTELV
jgi:hypothetical protein